MTTTDVLNDAYFRWYNDNERLRMRYPSEIVIGFLAHNMERKGRILDLGCGSGRHVILAAELGHEAHGVDLSDAGFGFCQAQAAARGLTVHLRPARMADTGYPDGFFDAVVCYSAISANALDDQARIIGEIRRLLTPGGVLLVNFYGPKDGVSLRGRERGREIARGTYLIPGNVFHDDASGQVPEYLCHISTEQEISTLLGDFSVVKQFEIYLPFGNASLRDGVKPFHALFAIARK